MAGKTSNPWPASNERAENWILERAAMDIRLQRAVELNFDSFLLGEVHLDKDRNSELQVKRHAGYE